MTNHERLIIDNRSSLSMEEALARCLSVVRKGKISEATVAGSKRKLYCWASAFEDGTMVITTPNEKSNRLTVTCRQKGQLLP